MKKLNEFTTAYPSVISNAQSQEYQGALAPIDAETVQGRDRLNPETHEGLHRINNFIAHAFKRITLNPQNEIAQLRVRLNHLNLDFPFDNSKPIESQNTYIVTKGGNAFGTTPTTDLSQGFNNGSDLPRYRLDIIVAKTEGGFKLEGKMSPGDELSESMIQKDKRKNRIETMKKIVEANESARSKRLRDPGGNIERESNKEIKRTYRDSARARR